MNYDETLEARWSVDSETGYQYLIDLKTGNIIATKNDKGIWNNPEVYDETEEK